MTDTEATAFNEKLAVAMNWDFTPDEDDSGFWTLPDGGVNDAPPFGTDYQGKRFGDFYTLPDFARDAHAGGYLLDWLINHTPPIAVDIENDGRRGGLAEWRAYLAGLGHCDLPRVSGGGETIGEALGRAILAFVEAEGQGEVARTGGGHGGGGQTQSDRI